MEHHGRHEKITEDLAYKLTKTMLEKREDLGQGPQGSAQHQAREPEVGQRRHPLASGRAEILQGKGHQARLS